MSLARSGFNLIGIVVVTTAVAMACLAFMALARQSGKSSHWFYQSQMAYNVADTGARETLVLLQAANDLTRAAASPHRTALEPLLNALIDGVPANVVLMDSSSAATLTPGAAAVLAGYGDFTPALEVTVSTVAGADRPLPAVSGVPAQPGERSGRVRIVAKASVKHPAAERVERALVVEKEYKIILRVPPLLGRFALFSRARPAGDLNMVKMRVNPLTGDARHAGTGPRPLVVRAGRAWPLVVPPADPSVDPPLRDHAALIAPGAPPADLLDRQGWIYLGGGLWDLNLAHGYGEYGESPLLIGNRSRVEYGASAGADGAFRTRFRNAWTSTFACDVTFPGAEDGLLHFLHGFASNYEILGLVAGAGAVKNAAGARAKLNFPAPVGEDSSCLRLFGHAPEVSPTLVFGPVAARVVQRAYLRMSQSAACSESGNPQSGIYQVFRLEDHDAGGSRDVLDAAFGADFEIEGTAARSVELAGLLTSALDPRVRGEVSPDGLQSDAENAGATIGTLRSDLIPSLPPITTPVDLSDATLKSLWKGELAAPRVFTGSSLGEGMQGFHDAVWARRTYGIVAEPGKDPMVHLRAGADLKVPGVVIVKTDAEVRLGAVPRVAEGGILIVLGKGNLRIDQNVLRGGPEPLTLVVTEGNVIIDPGVTRVEAYLVSERGQVVFGTAGAAGGGLTVDGGMACHTLDIESLRTNPVNRTLLYNADYDPASGAAGDPASRARLRAYYGDMNGEPRVAAMAGEGL